LEKNIRIFMACGLIIIYMLSWQYCAYGEERSLINDNDLYAKSALLMDGESKRVLYQKNGYEKLPMASTTKIMTCIVALENSNPNDVVEFSGYAASMPKVKLGAGAGRKFYMKDLLYSLMLESHNDTAVAIAEAVSGDVTEFANLMNKKAKEWGATNTNFVTPNGLDDTKHYTTAYDLALIASEAIKNEKFLEIINASSYSFSEIEGNGTYSVSNKDAFLDMMDGAIGIKTGFTGNAGYCFVGAVKSDNKTFISVVLASGWPPNKSYKWNDTLKLMKYGIANYKYKVIFAGVDFYKNIKVSNGIEEFVPVAIKGDCSTLLSDLDKVEYKYEIYNDVIEAPVKKEQIVGYMKILINDAEYAKYPICTKKAVKEIDFKYSFMIVLRKFVM
jgi:D-alanyl-D-alanine carboxypeptidase (penicillin-binding protein 5/6)